MADIDLLFTEKGGYFSRPFLAFQERLAPIKAYIFDWDGVFNDGVKNGTDGSLFSEVDAMGTNLLRFGHWLSKGTLPIVAIITGEENPAAKHLANREHFHSIYFKTSNKLVAFQHFLAAHKLQPHEVAFVFDDVLDLGVAAQCGLRLAIRHDSAVLFQQHLKENQLAEYISSGGDHGVREVCELVLGTTNRYEEVVVLRSTFDASYRQYLDVRQQVPTSVFTLRDGVVTLAQ